VSTALLAASLAFLVVIAAVALTNLLRDAQKPQAPDDEPRGWLMRWRIEGEVILDGQVEKVVSEFEARIRDEKQAYAVGRKFMLLHAAAQGGRASIREWEVGQAMDGRPV
jgi:hypothetical protein